MIRVRAVVKDPTEMGFLGSWFHNDSDPADSKAKVQVNWGAISGMVLSLAISATFWTGVGVFISRVVR